jgi:hypothetical protein
VGGRIRLRPQWVDLDAVVAQMQGSSAEYIQEPAEQPARVASVIGCHPRPRRPRQPDVLSSRPATKGKSR